MKRTVPMQWEQCIPILSIVLLRIRRAAPGFLQQKIRDRGLANLQLNALGAERDHAAIIYRTILPIF